MCSKSACTCFYIEKVSVPWWMKDLIPHWACACTHTHTLPSLAYLLFSWWHIHRSTSVGRLSRWLWAVDIIFCTKLAPLTSLGSLARKPGKSSSQSSSSGLDWVSPSILITLTFGPGHQLLFELCQQLSSWDSLPSFSLSNSFFFRPPEWCFSS